MRQKAILPHTAMLCRVRDCPMRSKRSPDAKALERRFLLWFGRPRARTAFIALIVSIELITP
jgi:hypothetical protein